MTAAGPAAPTAAAAEEIKPSSTSSRSKSSSSSSSSRPSSSSKSSSALGGRDLGGLDLGGMSSSSKSNSSSSSSATKAPASIVDDADTYAKAHPSATLVEPMARPWPFPIGYAKADKYPKASTKNPHLWWENDVPSEPLKDDVPKTVVDDEKPKKDRTRRSRDRTTSDSSSTSKDAAPTPDSSPAISAHDIKTEKADTASEIHFDAMMKGFGLGSGDGKASAQSTSRPRSRSRDVVAANGSGDEKPKTKSPEPGPNSSKTSKGDVFSALELGIDSSKGKSRTVSDELSPQDDSECRLSCKSNCLTLFSIQNQPRNPSLSLASRWQTNPISLPFLRRWMAIQRVKAHQAAVEDRSQIQVLRTPCHLCRLSLQALPARPVFQPSLQAPLTALRMLHQHRRRRRTPKRE